MTEDSSGDVTGTVEGTLGLVTLELAEEAIRPLPPSARGWHLYGCPRGVAVV